MVKSLDFPMGFLQILHLRRRRICTPSSWRLPVSERARVKHGRRSHVAMELSSWYIIHFYGGFSSTPCLMKLEGPDRFWKMRNRFWHKAWKRTDSTVGIRSFERKTPDDFRNVGADVTLNSTGFFRWFSLNSWPTYYHHQEHLFGVPCQVGCQILAE